MNLLLRAWMLLGVMTASVAAATLSLPADIDHAPWEDLLQRYVDDRGLVDYATWQASADDQVALDDYLAALAFVPADNAAAEGDAAIAALINAYNACTIRWILTHYPTPSIRETDEPWKGARWVLSGRLVSLDAIEHENLRPLYGWKVHATIVCAARSCPPLQRHAYTADNLEELTTRAWTAWLGREDLNRYDAADNTVFVSMIFKWFKADFTGDGALAKVLARFGPEEHRAWFETEDFDVEYLDYHWGLNDQGELGADYSRGLGSWLKRVF